MSLKDVLSTDDEIINVFLSVNNIKLKPHENSCILAVVNNLLENNITGPKASGYYINVQCNNLLQEEFDILRFGQESILNIEVKSSMPTKGIIYQMQRHKYLLSTLGKEVYCYTYIEEEDTLYQYNDSEISTVSFSELSSVIEDDYIDKNELDNIDTSTILVSPYSQPDKFTSHRYFLTNQQDEFKSIILECNKRFISISGKAGSGKSLLLFDIAKEMIKKGNSVCIYFCANLPQYESISEQIGIPIALIRSFDEEKLNNYDVLIFDEAQRLRKEQFETIVSSFHGSKVIFAVDQHQTLHTAEIKLNIEEKTQHLDNAEHFRLSKRIRVNAAIESFAERLLHYNCPKWNANDYSCIKLTYFTNEQSMKSYCWEQRRRHKTVIELTPYTTKTTQDEKMSKHFFCSEDSHSVIGKEYDDVLVVLNEYITYKTLDNGEIVLDSNYSEFYPYDVNHCIWEAISRTKKSLEIVIINNREMYNKISGILEKSVHK
ncbi:MAG: DUF2075 domain-containing protein [Clostridiales bacterium]|nr:DUF2075 domain-containing protein [Clostridiales bacterium]